MSVTLLQMEQRRSATVRFVLLPLEAHGYQGRESVLHMLWEMENWLDKYVKPEQPVVAQH
jgi:dipeptidyl aminopeptidase/acylaminoacyl peptidase